MKKTIIIINGRGGVGKDTCCDAAAMFYRVKTISSITPVKKIARLCGWNGEKDEKSRRFLSELKDLLIKFNDLPARYLTDKTLKFLEKNKHDILFVHIREIPEIEKYKKRVMDAAISHDVDVLTLLVTRKGSRMWNNPSDDKVYEYNYDFVYKNDCELSCIPADFAEFLQKTVGIEK